MSEFAEHWASWMMPEMRRRVRIAAIRIVTAPESDQNWETFNAALAAVENEAHRLGASHLGEEYQLALHDELRRLLVESIGTVLQPWHDAELSADLVAADPAMQAYRAWAVQQARHWAGLAEPSDPSTTPEPGDAGSDAET